MEVFLARPSSESIRRSALVLRLAREGGRLAGFGNATNKPRWVYIGSQWASCGAESASV